jgi:predicted acetyltransferase
VSQWTVRSATEDDQTAMLRLAATGFGAFNDPESRPPWRVMAADGGSVVVSEDGDIVGMARYLDMRLTVPGGAVLPAGGVSAVVVAPTHRRRGLLRAMYVELHDRIAWAGYPIAALTASEGGIYGRFGYGPATGERSLSVHRRFAQFHPDVPDGGGVRLVRPGDHREQILDIYERWRRATPGGLACPDVLWDDVLADRDTDRGGGTAWFGFLHADGCALYRVRHGETMVAKVEAMFTVTPGAHAALWRALLGLDLMDQVQIDTHPADPLPYLLVDARQVRTTLEVDALWLRIMDVPAALEARNYLADLRVVIEVGDEFRSDGGCFALQVRDGVAQCRPTDAPADMELDLDVLGSIYLGSHTVLDLAAANRIRCHDRQLLVQADLAFRSAVPARLGFHF